ncbi:hypothetical protein CQ062_22405 [Ochrobactrum sp. MYb68]|nr:hypothetical protein CQ062_22405 [Ochrobactrum sp. MYb68]
MATHSFLILYQLDSQDAVVGSATSITVDSGENEHLTVGDIVTMERLGTHFEFEFLYASGDGFVASLTQGSFPPGNYWFSDTPQINGTTAPNDGNSYYLCFLEGTLVMTPAGEIPVETLRIGDLVSTHEGKFVAVRWMGRRSVFSRFATPIHADPVCICRGALSDNVPCRDLYLSSSHALLIDGILIQAGALVNGTSIKRVRVPGEQFTYWHVETADHSLIIADGAPAETFVDNVTRKHFDNYSEFESMFPDAPTIFEMDYPRAKSWRQVPVAVRRRLSGRVAALGFTQELVA